MKDTLSPEEFKKKYPNIHITTKDHKPYSGAHVLDNPPSFHEKLLDYGERPYWSPDGKRIAFVGSNYGDICEIDFETREVRNLTRDLGEHHSFLRVLFLPNGDYLLIGPKKFKNRSISRHVESELWIMDKDASSPPKALGRAMYEGCGVSALSNKITYSMNGNHDPRLKSPLDFEVHVTEIEYGPNGPELGLDKIIHRTDSGGRPEPQDFRHNDTEVIMAEYYNNASTSPEDWNAKVKGINIATGEVRTYIDEALTHNECEGIFPDNEHICLESSRDFENSFPPIDLWKMKLDGTGRRVRMTRMFEHPPWRMNNSNVSPDGKWLAYMVNTLTDEPGYGRGLGLLNLEEWEKSDWAQQWELPIPRK
ncbi:PD40 domain-containing protein [Paenibacillus sepulcri]|uniref:PD40 domain-containing protein n=1 Tax=Paenibacillus sepulcri TaxID=359917 RepID=A0ABS7BVB5_9BACL|nr:PD40 domain-containing protein [Paenibacillus sepulcri]